VSVVCRLNTGLFSLLAIAVLITTVWTGQAWQVWRGNAALLGITAGGLAATEGRIQTDKSILVLPLERISAYGKVSDPLAARITTGLYFYSTSPSGLDRQTGEVMLMMGEWEAAVQVLAEAVDKRPGDAWARQLYAWALDMTGDQNEMARQLAVLGSADTLVLHCKQADTHALPTREKCLHLAVQVQPENAYLYDRLSDYYAAVGDEEISRQALLQALVLTQQSSPDYYLRSAQLALTDGFTEDAVAIYRLAVVSEAADYRVWREMGKVLYYQMRNVDEAVQAYQEAIRLKPCDISLYEALASIYAREGRSEEAENILIHFPASCQK
jgi:Flp pilus assembly protein TadD